MQVSRAAPAAGEKLSDRARSHVDGKLPRVQLPAREMCRVCLRFVFAEVSEIAVLGRQSVAESWATRLRGGMMMWQHSEPEMLLLWDLLHDSELCGELC